MNLVEVFFLSFFFVLTFGYGLPMTVDYVMWVRKGRKRFDLMARVAEAKMTPPCEFPRPPKNERVLPSSKL